jgi:hypothetical protein
MWKNRLRTMAVGGDERASSTREHTSLDQSLLTPQRLLEAPGARCAKRSWGAARHDVFAELTKSICIRLGGRAGGWGERVGEPVR